ncbi:MAG: alpha-hydroxy-acid oxidizing protein [Chloroflexi bacterium]|nr:alpha-hydroxy-acid oxidizing protein [Chloroflexota bacterium]
MKEFFTIEDAREMARRRLPRIIFDYLEGGAEDETTVCLNRAAFDKVTFYPRSMVDVSRREQATTVLGETVSLPVLLAPTGLARLIGWAGELAIARAAGKAGTVFAVSTASSYSLEDVAAAATGPLWFQLYLYRDLRLVNSLVERAARAGYRVLCVAIDLPVIGKRGRDLRNGLTIPLRLSLRDIFDASWRLAWLRNYLFGGKITLGNLQGMGQRQDVMSLWTYASKELVNPAANWDDLSRLREVWKGPLVVKGVMSVEDALESMERGADGIVVSNHGGRQLDGLPGTLDVLPEIVKAVNGRAEVFVDGGIRHGSDVVKAVALGARACLIGRPYLWGLAAQGESGVVRVLDILRDEIDRTLALIGRAKLGEVDRSVVRRIGL